MSNPPEEGGAANGSQVHQPGQAADGVTVPPPRYSRAAIASMVLGLLGILGITALVGLILSVVALRRIGRSRGRLRGRGPAIAGLILCLIALAGWGVFGAYLSSQATATGLLVKAAEAIEAEDYEEALSCVDHALGFSPQRADAWHLKGIILYDGFGQGNEALDCLENAVAIDPEIADAWQRMGHICSEHFGDLLTAIDYNDRALEIDPELATAWHGKASALLGMGAYDEALQCADRALELDSELAAAWNTKGVVLSDGFDKGQEAVKCLDRALEIDPEDAVFWNNKAVVLQHLERYGESLKCVDRALELDSEFARAWITKGGVMSNGFDKPRDALECYDRALELAPDNAIAHNNRGVELCMLRRYSEARKAFERSLELGFEGAETSLKKLGRLGR